MTPISDIGLGRSTIIALGSFDHTGFYPLFTVEVENLDIIDLENL